MILNIKPFGRTVVFVVEVFSLLVFMSFIAICPADAVEKQRVPSSTQQSKSLKLVREIFQQEFNDAKTSQQKSDLAQKLLLTAKETEGDSVGRYLLIKSARDMAFDAGNLAMTMSAIEVMNQYYEIDEFDARVRAITGFGERFDASQTTVFLDQLVDLTERAIAADDYDVAAQLSKAGKDAAEKSQDEQLLKSVQSMSERLDAMSAAFAKVKESVESLRRNPNVGAANLAVGKFRCLLNADWERGLPLLAKCDDPAWKSPAIAELAGTNSGEGKLPIADQWWKLAQGLEEPDQVAVKLHAGFYYQQAAPELTGLEKAKAAARLREAEKLGNIATAAPKIDKTETDDLIDAPAALEIKPVQLSQARVEYELPASFDDMAIAGGGRFLIFHFQTLNKLGLFDVNEGKITEYIPLENAEIRFTAGAEALFIALRQQNIIQRWSLRTFKRELAVKLPFENPVDVIAMGSAAIGPVFAGAKDAAGVFLDPKTLKPLPYHVVDHVYQKMDEKIPGAGPENRVRASANGQAFCVWGISGSPGGFRTMILSGKQIHIFYKHDTMGYIAPSPDGELMYTAKGVYTNQTKEFSANAALAAKSFPVPAVQGDYSLWVLRNEDQRGKENSSTSITVHLNGDAKPILTIPDIAIRPGQYSDFHGRELMTLDRRICFIPPANLIITLPDSNQRVVLHSMNLDKEMEEAGIDYLYVISRPTASVRQGATYRYQIEVKSKNGGVTYNLESGPDGMKVSGMGLVTWRVPRNVKTGNQDAIVAIKDSSDQEITHAFKVVVE